MQAGPWATYSSFAAVVPSDTTPINCRALYISVAGNVTVQSGPPGALGAQVTFTAPPVGSILPIQLDQGRVNAATTATVIALS